MPLGFCQDPAPPQAPGFPSCAEVGKRLLHVSFNRIRLKDKNMQQIKVLQRPLGV
ncbi:hypothetical protein GOC91_25625 [Sinorhizobium medicae]|uniref:Uncharacterized protein n=1 Tax=Sinorhizobium medicae TaxID=110321 RepID=A0A6G1WF40_9HYPH|nr:hypothetical protein [Sinorhizobium medicae]MDX0419704.1 hypothetical protein [Sinorhizobium medicae]MDX0425912.1 hypothetical protein [Sinorhizobium medicae]MDX0431698.1 hypothetical protein [Sinorhizobium medicae]MDX0438583.1 hypothetical protein [Sinorhizobium medicae]